jgi:hypothetical protein
MQKIDTTIATFGPIAAYQAAISRLQGDQGPMQRLGFNAPSLADANQLMSAAYPHMKNSQREIDLTDATDQLFDTPYIPCQLPPED